MYLGRIGFNGMNYYDSVHEVKEITKKCVYINGGWNGALRRIHKTDLDTIVRRTNNGEDWGLIWATGETATEARIKAYDIYIDFLEKKITKLKEERNDYLRKE